MLANTQLRETVATHLEQHLPQGMVNHVFDTWLMIDAEEDTPAIMVYLDDGDGANEYFDQAEKYDGLLNVSIYLGAATRDSDLDAIGEAVKQALPLGHRFPGVATLTRNGFNYERSETGAYRALHLNHAYKME